MRPTKCVVMAKYNSKTVNEICSHLKDGLSKKDSACLAGISESTFYEWLSLKSEFSESVERAILKYKQKLIDLVNKHAVKDGKLALEVLSRKYPYDFGKRNTLSVSKEEPQATPLNEETAKALINMFKEMNKEKKLGEPNLARNN